MLEQLTQIIQQVGTEQIAKHGIGTDKLEAVTKATSNTIMDGFKGAVSGGQIDQITSLLKGGDSVNAISSNPLVSGIIGSLISQLTSSVGLPKGASEGFAKAAIPSILASVIGKSKSKDSGFDVTDLISTLGGGDSAGMLGKLGGLLDGNAGGKSQGGALGNIVKGLFK